MSKEIDLYQEMAQLTLPKCVECPNLLPHRCCDKLYCDFAAHLANLNGVELPPPTGHPTLTYMGENGCVVPPHLRPICTVHVCSMNSMGFLYNKTGEGMFDRVIDIEGTEKYFELRGQLEEIGEQNYKSSYSNDND